LYILGIMGKLRRLPGCMPGLDFLSGLDECLGRCFLAIERKSQLMSNLEWFTPTAAVKLKVMLLSAVAEPPLPHGSHKNEHYSTKSFNSKLPDEASISLIDILYCIMERSGCQNQIKNCKGIQRHSKLVMKNLHSKSQDNQSIDVPILP
jgi:hypothetical protein